MVAEVEGARRRSTPSRSGCQPAPAARAGRGGRGRSRCPRPARRALRSSRKRRAPATGQHAGPGGRRDLRRLPARAVRPRDRRYRYPFITCTNCGPRFTIVAGCPVRPREHDDGVASRCARSAGGSTKTPPTGASTPSRSRARRAARASRCRSRTRLRRSSAPARSWRSRALGGLPPRVRRGQRGGGRAPARAQAPRGEAVRGDDGRRRTSLVSLTEGAGAASVARAADRPRSPPRPGAGRRVGRAGARGSACMLAYTPVHHLLLADAGCRSS